MSCETNIVSPIRSNGPGIFALISFGAQDIYMLDDEDKPPDVLNL